MQDFRDTFNSVKLVLTISSRSDAPLVSKSFSALEAGEIPIRDAIKQAVLEHLSELNSGK